MCAKPRQKIFNPTVIWARQIFIFLDKIPGFSKTVELCLNFCMKFYITLIRIIKLQKKQVIKTQVYINHASDLKARKETV